MTAPGRAGSTGAVDVFLNVTALDDNPFPALWTAAVRAAGGRVQHFGLRTVLRRRRAGRGWVQLQWPEWCLGGGRAAAATGLLRLLGLCLVARLLGHRLLLTVHNVRGHRREHVLLETLMWRVLGRLATHVHCFTAAGAAEVAALLPSTRRATGVVIPHGDYGPVLGPVPSRAAARAELGLTGAGRVLLVFGKLQAYKGITALLTAFASVPGADVRLLVRGAPADEATAALLREAAARDPRIDLEARYLSQAELTTAVAAADLVVLPYARVTNSGSALLALSVGRAVLLPRTPVFEELQGRCGPRWVRLSAGAPGARDLVGTVGAPADDERPDLGWCSWDAVADDLRALLGTGTGTDTGTAGTPSTATAVRLPGAMAER
ncbi:hypothetical protein GTR02_06865 [Kineococcus sp. R8]|uniref:glycosyltransferase n=1 Tax=Kineococcus siccus TaxID=2696567 RepID=UPI00141251E6|nr:hypothetical protein [Kineococcus siccus]NAZ81537.1 hypothetical protein [Kineococcus siccus]